MHAPYLIYEKGAAPKHAQGNASRTVPEMERPAPGRISSSIFALLLILAVVYPGMQTLAQAPQGISWQAVARASDGTLRQNQSVSIRLSVHDGSATAPVVYRETHSATTNAFGLVTLTLGQGNVVLGTFSSIDWGSGSKYLETELDPSGGSNYAFMGTTQLLSVPYALYAGGSGGVTLDAAYDGGGSGSGKTITADAGAVTVAGVDGFLATGQYDAGAIPATGWGTRMMWYPKKSAFRVGTVEGTQWDDANVGYSSIALGYNTTASGSHAVAFGYNTIAASDLTTAFGKFTSATGGLSTAFGSYTTASGSRSTAFGEGSVASGNYSTAFGQATNANGLCVTAIGRYNVGYGHPWGWDPLNTIFEIGIGTDDAHRANALTVLKNGNVGIGTHTPTQKLEVAGQVKITGGSPGSGKVLTSDADGLAAWQDLPVVPAPTLDAAYDGGGSGSGKTIVADAGAVTVAGVDGFLATGTVNSGSIPATGAGTRMMWSPRNAAFRAGHVDGSEWDGINIGQYSVAWGYGTKAIHAYSTAWGRETTASGLASTAMGYATTASGARSVAMGYATMASATDATAMGNYTNATGMFTTAVGDHTIASSYSSFTMGRYNVGQGSGTAWELSDPIFEIGIGTAPASKANALTVLKNGNVGIGTHTPTQKLEVTGQVKITGGSPGNGKVLTSDGDGLAAWQDLPAVPAPTLDAAYDGGGAGAGKTITADAGAFTVAGVDGFLSTGTVNSGSIPATGAGTRMMWYPGKSAFRVGTASGAQWDHLNIGYFSTALGYGSKASADHSIAAGYLTNATGLYSTAIGYETNASGEISTAMGYGTTASGDNSTAMGYGTTASGLLSTSIGRQTHASGDYSLATGFRTTASGRFSNAGGYYCKANGYYSTALGHATYATALAALSLGKYNVGIGDPYLWIASDPVFEIGIGKDSLNRANALTVLKNGNVGIGTHTPAYTLEVTGTAAKTGGGSWAVASDARLKNVDGPYMRGLDDILKLNSVLFHYKPDNHRRLPSGRQEIGFIAQEVREIIPEAVSELPDGYLDFDMHPVNVALVNAVKELNTKLEAERAHVRSLTAQLESEREAIRSVQNELVTIRALLEQHGMQPEVRNATMVTR